MIQTCEPKTRTSPARRRTSALPVLISIPNLAQPSRNPRVRVRRRRLRREVRVAGYLLLILLPLSMALATFAGDRRPFQTSAELVVEPPVTRVASIELQAPISITTLEPSTADDRQPVDEPVVLPALSLPVVAPEESSDGGH